jgi:hypothetical protein
VQARFPYALPNCFEKMVGSFSRKNRSVEEHFRKRKSITLISVMHPDFTIQFYSLSSNQL